MKLLSQCPPITCSLPHVFLILVKSTSIPVNNVGHFLISLFSSQLTHKQVLLSYIQRIPPARHCQSHPGPGLCGFSSGLLTPLIPFLTPYLLQPTLLSDPKVASENEDQAAAFPAHDLVLVTCPISSPTPLSPPLFSCHWLLAVLWMPVIPTPPSPVWDSLLPDTDRASCSLHSCLCSALSSQRSPPSNSLTNWSGRGRRHVSLLFITLHAASSRVPGAQ